jgi:hypothetical protein
VDLGPPVIPQSPYIMALNKQMSCGSPDRWWTSVAWLSGTGLAAHRWKASRMSLGVFVVRRLLFSLLVLLLVSIVTFVVVQVLLDVASMIATDASRVDVATMRGARV